MPWAKAGNFTASYILIQLEMLGCVSVKWFCRDTAVPPVVETPRCKKCQGSGYTVVGEIILPLFSWRELLKLERRDLPNMGDPSD